MSVWPTSQKTESQRNVFVLVQISVPWKRIYKIISYRSVRTSCQSIVPTPRLATQTQHLLTWVHAAPSCVEHLMASFVISCSVRHVSAGLGERWVMNEYWWDIDPPGLQTEGQISHVDSLAAEVTTRGGGSCWNLKPSDVLCRSWRDLHTDPSVFILQHDL